MPVLSASQTTPVVRQDARLTVRVSVTAAHEVPAPEQTATLDTGYLPGATLSANQTMEPGTQRVRLIVTPWKGPAEPRAERQPAKPR